MPTRLPRRLASQALCALAFAPLGLVLANTPFWGDKQSQPVETPPLSLKSGQWIWSPGNAPEGPIVVTVGLDLQVATVYRNGIAIGYAAVSTGRKGYETPTGVFTTLQKDRDHHSSIYQNAAMPFTQRLTWGGVALHAGGLPGYPSSHGCVHLPSAFAEQLFAASPLGMTVVISKTASRPEDVAHPMALAPLEAKGGQPLAPVARLGQDESMRWTPEKSPEGPISIVLSSADQRLLVLRNGIEIGRARVTLATPGAPLGTHVYMLRQPVAGAAPAAAQWLAVAVPGHSQDANRVLDPAAAAQVQLPPRLRALVEPTLAPGATLVVTDAPILEKATTGVAMTVLTNNGPAGG